MASDSSSKLAEWGWKILSALVIPLILWGVKLEVNNAVQDERISTLQEDLKETKGMQAAINANTNALGKLEVKIGGVNGLLKDIVGALRD